MENNQNFGGTLNQNVGNISDSIVKNVNNCNSFNQQNSETTLYDDRLFFVELAILSVLLVICLGLFLPYKGDIKFDYIGVIVAIFAVLITLLIGWQIVHYLRIVNEIKDNVKLRIDLFETKFNDMTEDLKNERKKTTENLNETREKYSKDFEILSSSVYSSFFQAEKIKYAKDINTYYLLKYGLLTVQHSQYVDMKYCELVIKELNSFQITNNVRDAEKSELIILAHKISETSIAPIFQKLYCKIKELETIKQ